MYNSLIEKSKKYGSVIPITNGINWDLIQSGFTVDVESVPAAKDGHLPAGMLLICDESNHKAVPFKVAKVESVSGSDIEITKNGEYCAAPFVVGESIMKLGSNFTTKGTAAVISAIDDTTITTATTLTLAKGDYIIICKADGSHYGAPNALMPFDAWKEEGAFAVTVQAARTVDGDIFENRIPEIPTIAKESLRDAGCRFGWSKSR